MGTLETVKGDGMRYSMMALAPDDRIRRGRQPNEDDIGKPSNLGDATELDPPAKRESKIQLPDIDATGPSFMDDTEELLDEEDSEWLGTESGPDNPARGLD
jgi:hypothetical protein